MGSPHAELRNRHGLVRYRRHGPLSDPCQGRQIRARSGRMAIIPRNSRQSRGLRSSLYTPAVHAGWGRDGGLALLSRGAIVRRSLVEPVMGIRAKRIREAASVGSTTQKLKSQYAMVRSTSGKRMVPVSARCPRRSDCHPASGLQNRTMPSATRTTSPPTRTAVGSPSLWSTSTYNVLGRPTSAPCSLTMWTVGSVSGTARWRTK